MEASTMELLPPPTILFNVSSAPSVICEDMNAYLWNTRRDLTTCPFVMAVFASLYSSIILLGIIGNSCVIMAIARIKSLQTVPNMFIFSLSCSDILVCFISATITPIAAFKKDWIFGQFLCSFAPFVAGGSLCFSTFTLAAISVDRFLLILFPTRKAFSHTQALFIILVAFLLASGFSLPMLFMQKLKPVTHYCGRFCFEDWGEMIGIRRIYGTLLLTVQFIIPLALITFCYTAISFRLGKSVNLRTRKKCEWQMPISAQRNAATKRRQRTNRMFIAMVIAFSVSWIWSVLYNLLRDYDGLPKFVHDQEFFFGILTHCIAMSSTVWNPILYALLNLQLRAAFLQLVPQCIRHSLTCTCSPNKGRLSGRSVARCAYLEESRLLGSSVLRGTTGQVQRRETNYENKNCFNCLIGSSRSVESSSNETQKQTFSVKCEGNKGDAKILSHNHHRHQLERITADVGFDEQTWTEQLRKDSEDDALDDCNDDLRERDTDERI
uniref:Flp-18 GPCR receptor n=3 Tax=Meloidogyne incognita group TaxID=654580 RepID=Q2TGX5_MELIC|nr:flp-18 GPCR receptor [Meloidogyne incognita]